MAFWLWIFGSAWLLCTVLSTAALVRANSALVRKSPIHRIVALEQAVSDQEYALNSLQSSIKRLNARVGMREARAKAQDEAPDAELPRASSSLARKPNEPPDAWKARVRPIIHTVPLTTRSD